LDATLSPVGWSTTLPIKSKFIFIYSPLLRPFSARLFSLSKPGSSDQPIPRSLVILSVGPLLGTVASKLNPLANEFLFQTLRIFIGLLFTVPLRFKYCLNSHNFGSAQSSPSSDSIFSPQGFKIAVTLNLWNPHPIPN